MTPRRTDLSAGAGRGGEALGVAKWRQGGRKRKYNPGQNFRILRLRNDPDDVGRRVRDSGNLICKTNSRHRGHGFMFLVMLTLNWIDLLLGTFATKAPPPQNKLLCDECSKMWGLQNLLNMSVRYRYLCLG